MRCLFFTLLFASTSSYVYNGNDAPPALYRFFVDMSGCGGALISSRFMITAAHCVDPRADENLRGMQMEVTTRTVERVRWDVAHYERRHPISIYEVFMFDAYQKKDHMDDHTNAELITIDFAFVQLAEPVSVCDDEFGPLALLLPFEDDQAAENMFKADEDHQCLQVGFGGQTTQNIEDDQRKPRHMKQQRIRGVTVIGVDLGGSEPARMLNMSSNIPGTHVCKGDSGSPIFCIVNDYPTLMSVTSAGDECGRPHASFLGTDIRQMLPIFAKKFSEGGASMWDELMEDQEKCRSYYEKNGFLTEYVNRIKNRLYPPFNGMIRDVFVYPPAGSIKMDGSWRPDEADSTTSPSISFILLTLIFYV